MNLNKLLEKQIKQWLDNDCLNQEQVKNFINAVNDSYNAQMMNATTHASEDKINKPDYPPVNNRVKACESHFRQVFEKISDNVWEFDFSTHKTYFSNTNNQLLGYGFSEFSSNENLWWERTIEEDRVLVARNRESYLRGEISHHVLEYRVMHKDGTIRWVMDRGVLIEATGDNKPSKLMGTYTDITERKHGEELFQREEQKYLSIIANMNLGLLEVDTEENVVFTNQSFCEMSGYEYDELIGKRASQIYIKGENMAYQRGTQVQ